MIRLLSVPLLLGSMSCQAGELFTESSGLSVSMGNCSVLLGEYWELVAIDEESTVFEERRDIENVLIYSRFDQTAFTGGTTKVLSRHSKQNVSVLHVTYDSPATNIDVIDVVFVHDEQYMIYIQGESVRYYLSREFLDDRIECRASE